MGEAVLSGEPERDGIMADDTNILLDAFKQKPAAAIEYMKRKGYGFSWNASKKFPAG